MVFYRFIKKAIKFILYQLPKKWLVMIIFAFLMTFGLTQVKAANYDGPNMLQWKEGTTTLRITSDTPFYYAKDNTNANYWSAFKMGTTDQFVYINLYRNGSLQYSNIGAKQVGGMYSNPTNITGFGKVAMYNSAGTLLYSSFVEPYISTTSSLITSYTFDYLVINGGTELVSTANSGTNKFKLTTQYMGISVDTDINKYMSVDNGALIFTIPKSELIDNPSVATGRVVKWILTYDYYEGLIGRSRLLYYYTIYFRHIYF